MTEISIIGTGSMARELGKGWVRAGHHIVYGSRNPMQNRPELPSTDIRTYGDAVTAGDVVVLAVPFLEVVPLVSMHRELLLGKTIIDISNPFDHLPHNERAGIEFTADALGTTDGLVAAFKDNFAATINAEQPADGKRADVKIAGDDEAAKKVVGQLAADLDHRVIDCGALRNARYIDPMVSLMLQLDERYEAFTMRTGWRFCGLSFA